MQTRNLPWDSVRARRGVSYVRYVGLGDVGIHAHVKSRDVIGKFRGFMYLKLPPWNYQLETTIASHRLNAVAGSHV